MGRTVPQLIVGCALLAWFTSAARANDDMELARKITSAQVRASRLDEPLRGKVAQVLSEATLYSRSRSHAFPCQPPVYEWLLDHPDWACRAWRVIGAKCATIERRPDGSFFGRDEQGGELRWKCIVTEPGMRVWYAEGSGRPNLLAPSMSVRVVLVLQHDRVRGADGRTGVRHRAELFAHFDSAAAAWATKVLGMSTDSAAKKTLEQVELFFSGMAWYLSEDPAKARAVLRQVGDSSGSIPLTPDPSPKLGEGSGVRESSPLPPTSSNSARKSTS